MKYTVYILYSQSKNRYYIGYMQDPEAWLTKLSAAGTPSTGPGFPGIFVYKEDFLDKTAAIKRQKSIKKFKDRKCIENLIKNQPAGNSVPLISHTKLLLKIPSSNPVPDVLLKVKLMLIKSLCIFKHNPAFVISSS